MVDNKIIVSFKQYRDPINECDQCRPVLVRVPQSPGTRHAYSNMSDLREGSLHLTVQGACVVPPPPLIPP